MPITIIKKALGALTKPAPAPVVPPVSEPPQQAPQTAQKPASGGIRISVKKPVVPQDKPNKPVPRTYDEVMAYWKNVPPPNAKAKECAYCHNWYIRPCDQNLYSGCANYLWLKEKEGAK